MTMARFPRGAYTADGGRPEWIEFLREVNGVRSGTFTAPTELKDATPAPGYSTEVYDGARVIHAPGDEGVRVVADSDSVAAAFLVAAARMGVHMAGTERFIVIGLTESDRAAGYSSFDDGYRPDARQELHLIKLFEDGPIPAISMTDLNAEQWAEAVFVATNAPPEVPDSDLWPRFPEAAVVVRRALGGYTTPMRSLSVGDTVTVAGQTWACQRAGWERVAPV